MFIEWVFIEFLSSGRQKDTERNTADPLLSKKSESRLCPQCPGEEDYRIGSAVLRAAVKELSLEKPKVGDIT